MINNNIDGYYTTVDCEIEAVKAIFSEEVQIISDLKICVVYSTDVRVTLTMHPLGFLDNFEVSGPSLLTNFKKELIELIEKISSKTKENEKCNQILYELVEAILEFCKENLNQLNKLAAIKKKNQKELLAEAATKTLTHQHEATECNIEIKSGNYLEDRKSIFQAHIASISSKDDAINVLRKLKSNNKIGRATHNIYAWRVTQFVEGGGEHGGRCVQLDQHDCDCDGEFGAGPKLLRLLEQMKATNLIVIVTRWYGGRHLGPDRFRHINNVARELILQSGFLISKKKKLDLKN